MKKITLLIFSLLFCNFTAPVFAEDAMKDIREKFNLSQLKKKDFKDPQLKTESAFIYTILQNTNELKIHQMNGEINNRVFITDKSGRHEIVVAFEIDKNGEVIDGTGKHVTDCLNMASLNYHHPYKSPLSHFSSDILPWLLWGNCKDDPSSIEQRVSAYILDFKEGFHSSINESSGFYLPKGFKFKGEGQPEAVAFFLKALETSGFNLQSFYPHNLDNPESQALFFKALESGITELIKNA